MNLPILICDIKNNENGLRQLINFLNEVDEEFPIPLSNKTSIDIYAKKQLSNGVVLQVTMDNEIAGIIMGYMNDLNNKTAYASLLCVKKKFRGKGIARQLVSAFIEKSRSEGMKTLHLYTHKTNDAPIHLYKSMGFTVDKVVDSNQPDDIHFLYKL